MEPDNPYQSPDQRRRSSRPKWMIGTLLLVIGWSIAVISLNIRPQIHMFDLLDPDDDGSVRGMAHYGFPFVYATSTFVQGPSNTREFRPHTWDGASLASDVLFGFGAVYTLTFGSVYLLRRIIFGLACDRSAE